MFADGRNAARAAPTRGHAAVPKDPDGVAGLAWVGRQAHGRGAEARGGAAEPAAPAARSARGPLARSRHAAGAGRAAVAALGAGVSLSSAVACRFTQGGVPRRPFFGADG